MHNCYAIVIILCYNFLVLVENGIMHYALCIMH